MDNLYYHTEESVNEYIQLAKDVSGVGIINRLKKVLSNSSSILELGSGPGTDWRILNELYDVTGSDFSKQFISHLSKKNPRNSFLNLNAVTIRTDKRFDAIYSNKVLHHLTNDQLKESIIRQAEILNAQGFICHTFWLGNGSEYFKGMFVNYHTKEELDTLFKQQFEILTLEEYNEFEDNDSIVLIAKLKS